MSPKQPHSAPDASLGPAPADLLRHLRQRTHSTRVLPAHSPFAGLFRLDYNEKLFARNYKDPVLVASSDSVGSKAQFAATLKKYDTIGIDLVAKNVNSLIVQGGEPLFLLHHLALHQPDPDLTAQILTGLSDACITARCALLGGDEAATPALYPAGHFDLAGFALGVVEKSRIPDPADVQVGDSVIGLASSGLHANGYALVQHVLHKSGQDLHPFLPELHCSLAEELLRPTRIYAPAVASLLGKYKVKRVVKSMAHIARGGLAGNIPHALPPGLAVRLKRDAWPLPPIFSWLQRRASIDIDEMFRAFNMGIGFLLVVRPAFTKPILSHLRTCGEKPFFLGKIKKAAADSPLEWT